MDGGFARGLQDEPTRADGLTPAAEMYYAQNVNREETELQSVVDRVEVLAKHFRRTKSRVDGVKVGFGPSTRSNGYGPTEKARLREKAARYYSITFTVDNNSLTSSLDHQDR